MRRIESTVLSQSNIAHDDIYDNFVIFRVKSMTDGVLASKNTANDHPID